MNENSQENDHQDHKPSIASRFRFLKYSLITFLLIFLAGLIMTTPIYAEEEYDVDGTLQLNAPDNNGDGIPDKDIGESMSIEMMSVDKEEIESLVKNLPLAKAKKEVGLFIYPHTNFLKYA